MRSNLNLFCVHWWYQICAGLVWVWCVCCGRVDYLNFPYLCGEYITDTTNAEYRKECVAELTKLFMQEAGRQPQTLGEKLCGGSDTSVYLDRGY